MHGVTPGPLFITQHPEIFMGIIASMYVGNFMLLLMNLPLIGLWIRILRIPFQTLFPLILLFCLIGSYSIRNSFFDIVTMLIAGIAGYVLRKFHYEEAPLLLAFILGPMLEQAFRQSLIISNGELSIFFTRPISCVALVLAIGLFFSNFIGALRKGRDLITKVSRESEA
jgi:putative tricarboxylic transport membrane protein